jgi:hypothetical protein
MKDSDSCEYFSVHSEDQLDDEVVLGDYLCSHTPCVKGEILEIHFD